MLPKSIIKKYGITKKAWSVYRKKKPKLKVKVRGKPKKMAKRRTYRRKKTNKSFIPSGIMKPLSAGLYGYTRDKISDFIASTTIAKKLPVTNFTDEGVMLAVLWGSGKLGLNKMKGIRSFIQHGKTVEWARIGQTISDMQQSKGGMNVANEVYAYG